MKDDLKCSTFSLTVEVGNWHRRKPSSTIYESVAKLGEGTMSSPGFEGSGTTFDWSEQGFCKT